MIQPTFYPRAQSVIDNGRVEPFDLVGLLPQMLSADAPLSAVHQLNYNYTHGGGWHDFTGFTLDESDPMQPRLNYPGDPPTEAVAWWKLRNERIILFDHAWVAVVQADGSFRVARMD